MAPELQRLGQEKTATWASNQYAACNVIHIVYLLTLICCSREGFVIKIYWFPTNPASIILSVIRCIHLPNNAFKGSHKKNQCNGECEENIKPSIQLMDTLEHRVMSKGIH